MLVSEDAGLAKNDPYSRIKALESGSGIVKTEGTIREAYYSSSISGLSDLRNLRSSSRSTA